MARLSPYETTFKFTGPRSLFGSAPDCTHSYKNPSPKYVWLFKSRSLHYSLGNQQTHLTMLKKVIPGSISWSVSAPTLHPSNKFHGNPLGCLCVNFLSIHQTNGGKHNFLERGNDMYLLYTVSAIYILCLFVYWWRLLPVSELLYLRASWEHASPHQTQWAFFHGGHFHCPGAVMVYWDT